MKVFVVLALVNGVFGAFTSLTSTQVNSAKTAITSLLRSNGAIHPTALRLAFHDCVGGCDGCINLDNDSNAGLSDVITAIDGIYVGTFDSIMSRADFWALAGIVSVEIGLDLNSRQCTETDCTMPTTSGIEFLWGRVDCETSPSTTDTHTFPGATMTADESLAYFSSQFDFSDEDVVAIMGAHTLGGASENNSGYRGTWIAGERRLFNQRYYGTIASSDITFTNRDVARNTDCNCNRWQFNMANSDGTGAGFMLNTDVELYKNLTLSTTGQSTCDYATECPLASTSNYVTTYAADGQAFMSAFATAYKKMTSKGYESLKTVSS